MASNTPEGSTPWASPVALDWSPTGYRGDGHFDRTTRRIDERQPQFRPERPPQVIRRLGQNHLQRRPYLRFDRVATARRGFRQPEEGVDMDARFTVLLHGDVADQRQHLGLPILGMRL